MSWVYIRSEPGLYTVGHYGRDGAWHTDSDHGERESAAARCAMLNGSAAAQVGAVSDRVQALAERVDHLTHCVAVLRDWISDHTPGQDYSRLWRRSTAATCAATSWSPSASTSGRLTWAAMPR